MDFHLVVSIRRSYLFLLGVEGTDTMTALVVGDSTRDDCSISFSCSHEEQCVLCSFRVQIKTMLSMLSSMINGDTV